jgi:hypothetical protein
MKRVIFWLAIAGLLVGGFFLLHKQVLWLDYFDGTLVKRIEDQVATVRKVGNQTISNYSFAIETDDGREVLAPVDQLVYFRAREGMRVHKSPFSSTIELAQ